MPKVLAETIEYGPNLSIAWVDGVPCTITINSTHPGMFHGEVVPAVKELCERLSRASTPEPDVMIAATAGATALKQITGLAAKVALTGNIPEVSEADRAEANRLAKVLSDAQERLSSIQTKPDPLARWLGPDGQVPASKQRARWNVGRQYNYVDIVQTDTKQIDPHGECWVLKLANGDTVLTDMDGRELEYACSDPVLVAPEWMNPTGDLPTTVTLPTPAPVVSAPTPVRVAELTQDVRAMRKVSAVLDWLRKNQPDVLDTEANTVKWLWAHREQLVCMKGLKEPDVVRRVEVAFTIA